MRPSSCFAARPIGSTSITLWAPAYGLEAVVKVATAAVSAFTAIALWRLLPVALTLPSPAQYRAASEALSESEARLHQAQKMETVGQLTGGVAHDFNNILQVITSGLTLMERKIQQGRIEEAGAYIPAMRQAADSAAGLTNHLLAFSRRQALQPRVVSPDQLLGDMEPMIQRTLGPGIVLQTRLLDGRWNVYCDPHQLEAALLNLAVNGRDAMPEGGTLTIGTADRTLTAADLADPEEAKAGDYVEFNVADTGEGMSPAILARVFEPFFTTKPAGKGTGLGLSQVYGFVKQSGGFVRIDSKPGAGTTVRIFLPANERATEVLRAPLSVAMPVPVASRAVGGKILVVEDQENVRLQLREALAEIGYAVSEARDGPEGLRAMQAGPPPDLLITDIGLPGLNGRQLAEAARAVKPNLPVLLITGFAGNALTDGELPSGMEVMRKPFALDEIIARVRDMLVEKIAV